jgi:hypothetical protein
MERAEASTSSDKTSAIDNERNRAEAQLLVKCDETILSANRLMASLKSVIKLSSSGVNSIAAINQFAAIQNVIDSALQSVDNLKAGIAVANIANQPYDRRHETSAAARHDTADSHINRKAFLISKSMNHKRKLPAALLADSGEEGAMNNTGDQDQDDAANSDCVDIAASFPLSRNDGAAFKKHIPSHRKPGDKINTSHLMVLGEQQSAKCSTADNNST